MAIAVMFSAVVPFLLSLLACSALALSEVKYAVRCSVGSFDIVVNMTSDMVDVKLRKVPTSFAGCPKTKKNNQLLFSIKLDNSKYSGFCGVTEVDNRVTNERTLYQQLTVQYRNGPSRDLQVKCQPAHHKRAAHNIVKRSPQEDGSWPAGFQEPEILDITSEVVGKAPEPQLSVQVRQDGEIVNTSLDVRPGSPLMMEIFLDQRSSGTYGIIVSQMVVSDTDQAEEQILADGCSVDPQLFGNFNTSNGDVLVAPFRAFKFPNTNFVLFQGILNVCIDRCEGVECNNGQIGYGRRRRRSTSDRGGGGPNSVFQVTTNTIISVQFQDDSQTVEAGLIREQFRRPFAVGSVKPVSSFTSVPAQDTSDSRLVSSSASLVTHSAVTSLVALVATVRWL